MQGTLVRSFLVVFFAMAAVVGCGSGDGHDRMSVSGTVTLDGKPLPTGSVRLIPVAEGTAAGAEISNGQFTIPEESGPAAGEYKVEITSYQETGKMVPGMSGMEPVREQIIPEKFNSKSELQATLEEGKDNALKFDLTSK